jgi:WD40 repeat protein
MSGSLGALDGGQAHARQAGSPTSLPSVLVLVPLARDEIPIAAPGAWRFSWLGSGSELIARTGSGAVRMNIDPHSLGVTSEFLGYEDGAEAFKVASGSLFILNPINRELRRFNPGVDETEFVAKLPAVAPAEPSLSGMWTVSSSGGSIAYLSPGEPTILSLLDFSSGRTINTELPFDWVADISWSPDGKFLLISAGNSQDFATWSYSVLDANGHPIWSRTSTEIENPDWLGQHDLVYRSKPLSETYNGPALQVVDPTNGVPITSFHVEGAVVCGSPDGSFIILADTVPPALDAWPIQGPYVNVRVVAAADGTMLMQAQMKPITGLMCDWSSDGRVVLSSSGK